MDTLQNQGLYISKVCAKGKKVNEKKHDCAITWLAKPAGSI